MKPPPKKPAKSTSKVDQLRAMREARWAADQAAAKKKKNGS